MKSPRVLAIAALFTLSDCSLLFDPSDLGRGAQVGDARTQSSDDGGDDVSTVDSGAATPDGSIDGAGERDSEPTFDAPSTLDATEGAAESSVAQNEAAADVEAASPAFEAGMEAGADGRADAAAGDGAAEAGDGSPDAAAEGGSGSPDAGPGSLSVGVVAYYPFDETGGATAADASGNGQTALMHGATFAPGRRGNAATMNGSGQYVSLPSGIVAGLTSCSISLWSNLADSSALIHIFDFGTGLTAYISLSSSKFAITVGGLNAEQRINIPTISAAVWHHVVFTLAAGVGTIYVDGRQIAQNPATTLTPSKLGTTTQNWLGRSQDPTDLFLNGQIDQFRIYGRALTTNEIQQLFQLRL